MDAFRPHLALTSTQHMQIFDHDPNNDSNSKISQFIINYIILNLQVPEGEAHRIARIILQVISVFFAFLGRAPFIELNMKLGGENKVYGGFLAFGTCASFGYLVAYALLDIVDAQMRPRSSEEKALLESRMSSTIKKACFAVATILGFTTQIPFAYLAYKYNAPSTFNPHGLLMPLMVFLIDSWVTTYSAYGGMKTLREQQSLTPQDKKLAAIRDKLCAFIETTRLWLTTSDAEKKEQFIAEFERITRLNEPERVCELYALFTQKASEQTLNPSQTARHVESVVRAFGYLCAFCNIGTLAYVAYRGTDELTHNIYASSTISIIYAGTALYLNTKAIPATAVKLFRLFKDLSTCSYQPTLSDQLTPKLSFVLKIFNLVTALLSYGLAIEISKDYYQSHEELKIFMEIILPCASTLLVLMAILAINDQVLEYKIEKTGTPKEKQLIEVNKKMQRLGSIFAASPISEIVHFLKGLPEEDLKNVMEGTGISPEDLYSYILNDDDTRDRRQSLDV